MAGVHCSGGRSVVIAASCQTPWRLGAAARSRCRTGVSGLSASTARSTVSSSSRLTDPCVRMLESTRRMVIGTPV
jgi:hypothetical protein